MHMAFMYRASCLIYNVILQAFEYRHSNNHFTDVNLCSETSTAVVIKSEVGKLNSVIRFVPYRTCDISVKIVCYGYDDIVVIVCLLLYVHFVKIMRWTYYMQSITQCFYPIHMFGH